MQGIGEIRRANATPDKAEKYRVQRDKLLAALRKIAAIKVADLAEYCRQADGIAVEALAQFDAEG